MIQLIVIALQPFTAEIPQFLYCSGLVVMPYLFCQNKIIRRIRYTKENLIYSILLKFVWNMY